MVRKKDRGTSVPHRPLFGSTAVRSGVFGWSTAAGSSDSSAGTGPAAGGGGTSAVKAPSGSAAAGFSGGTDKGSENGGSMVLGSFSAGRTGCVFSCFFGQHGTAGLPQFRHKIRPASAPPR